MPWRRRQHQRYQWRERAHPNRISTAVAPHAAKRIVWVRVWLFVVVVRRAGSVRVKLLVRDLLDRPAHHFCFSMQRAEEQPRHRGASTDEVVGGRRDGVATPRQTSC